MHREHRAHRASTGSEAKDASMAKRRKGAQSTQQHRGEPGAHRDAQAQADARREIPGAQVHAVRRAQAQHRALAGACAGTQAGTQAHRQPGMHAQAQAQVHPGTGGHAHAGGRTGTPTGECGRVWGGEGSRIIEPNLGASYMRTEPESNCMRTSTTRSTRGHLVAPKVVLYQVLIRARAAAT